VGTGIYFWQHNKLEEQKRESSSRINELQAKIKDLQKSDTASDNNTNNVKHVETYSVKMPNGKTLSYPLTSNNQSIIWWYGGCGDNTQEPNGTYIYTTTAESIRFLSEIDNAYLQRVCNTPTLDLRSINKWAVTTATKQITKGQAASCLDSLADPRFDSVGKYREQAKQLLDNEKQSIEEFA